MSSGAPGSTQSGQPSDPNLKNIEAPSQGLEPTDQSRSRQDQLEVRPQGRPQEVRLQVLFQAVEDLVLRRFRHRARIAKARVLFVMVRVRFLPDFNVTFSGTQGC